MTKLSDADYQILDDFIKAALERVENRNATASDTASDIMHPLTAWDQGNDNEFAPWMKLRMKKWSDDT